MPARTARHEPTRLVRIVRDDGEVIETEMTLAMERSIRRMEWAEEKRERRHKRREKTFTDAKVKTGQLEAALRAKHRKAGEKPGRWEGPRPVFTLHYGMSAIWSGPDSLTVIVGGRKICRFCSAVRKMPECACCLGCDRVGAG